MKKILQVRTLDGVRLVNFEDILHSQADGSYCKLYLYSGEKLQLSQNLKSLTEKLDSSFIRVSRSALVHCRYIQRVDKKNKTIHLTNGQIVRYTFSYKEINCCIQRLIEDPT